MNNKAMNQFRLLSSSPQRPNYNGENIYESFFGIVSLVRFFRLANIGGLIIGLSVFAVGGLF